MKSLSYQLPFYSLFLTSPAFAEDGIVHWREYVYLIELAVIGLMALALIVLTMTIFVQKKRSSQLFIDFREEVKQEKAIINATINDMKGKEKQIAYMADMLQKDMHEFSEDARLKKKSRDERLSDYIELEQDSHSADILPLAQDEANSTRADVSFLDETFDILTDVGIDPRTVSADGSVKTQHLGAHAYMTTIKHHQDSAWKKSTDTSKAFTGLLTKVMEQTDKSLNTTSKHREHLKESIAILQADIDRVTNDEDSRSDELIATMTDLEGRIRLLHDYEHNLRSIYSHTLQQLSGYNAPDFVQEIEEVATVKAES
ncbi:MAG: Unknown protein [uncultured Thiotrichaceae bacterium]|uniref:Uncharacterized protein n=1 Tax=uncultured Thiotrichaceae bacterium TaxID=298394 RepID=A0A6S6RXW4_9GAMM|nr:MAG: Unknown protein [uncultured Thiotrichaceae bacterium]